ncbi:Beta-barrel assembly-enhancing protease [invertebrate metagenome]|uniref:Beta-barrel assembly-enhancing protease n=1 Tax=invertebrate metagenome TaxID=1711999 RepID=A0A2H9TC22_9ZZZZ
MKYYAWFLGALAVCGLIATAMVSNTGYILIAYKTMTFESTLWGLLLLLIIVLGVVWFLSYVVRLLYSLTNIMYPLSDQARIKKARRLSLRGLLAFTHGHWKQSEKYLAAAAQAGDSPLINYLAAARAAHEAGHYESSTQYLRDAELKSPGASLAIGISQAQLQLSSGRLEQALATLKRLHKKWPQHVYVLKLLKQVYLKLSDWQALAKLLPVLAQKKVVSDKEYLDIEQQAFDALFAQACHQGNLQDNTSPSRLNAVNKVWESLSRVQRRDPAMIFRYARSLVTLNAQEKAEQVVHDNLVRHYSRDLIRLYGKIAGQDTQRQLLSAEGLLNERTNDAELLLALGRLSLRNGLLGKAREYFEASLKLCKSVDVYNELGRLLAHMDDFEKSTEYFREGLCMAADSVVDFSLPAARR